MRDIVFSLFCGLCLLKAVSAFSNQRVEKECTSEKVDITFVLDYSLSVGQYNFENFMLPAVANVIEGLGTISAETARVALVGFSSRAYLEFVFNDFLDKRRLIQMVRSLRYKHGNTATGEALFLVKKDLVPRVRTGVKHLVIVVTDGLMNEGRPLEPEAEALRISGAELFAIGVGAYMDKKELLKIGKSEDHVLLLKDFNDLLLRAKEITKRTCDTLTDMKDPVDTSSGKCTGGRTDVTFILDASGSVGIQEYNVHVKPAVQAIVGALNIGPAADRVAVIQYSTTASLIFNLDSFNNAAEINNAIQNIRYTAGGTATGDAIALAQQLVVPKVRVGVTHIVIVITDGNSNMGRQVVPAVAALKRTGAVIFSVGVGAQITRKSLLEIASKPENVISVNNYADLRTKALSIAKSACQTAVIEEVKLPQICNGRQAVYITLLIDVSSDQGVEHFRSRIQRFIHSVVNTLSPLQSKVSFALVTYSGTVQVEFDFSTYGQSFENILKHIEGLKVSNSRERLLGRALQTIRSEISGKVKPGATHIVAIFTAGEPSQSDCYTEVAKLLVESGAQLVVVTSHHQMERKTLNDLTSLSSYVDGSMRAFLTYREGEHNTNRVNGVVSVMCALTPVQAK